MNWPDDYIGKVICGDAIELMKNIPDGMIDVILTDPAWPNCKVDFSVKDPLELLTRAGREFERLTERIIIHLGCDTDPRFLIAIPSSIPFFRVCWLRRIPPTYRGSLMYDADIAYIFGHRRLPGDGSRVMGGQCDSGVSRGKRDPENTHPTPRNSNHVKWLISRFTRPGDLILDPFAGSGTTLREAKNAGRFFIGMDISSEYCEIARRGLNQEQLEI